MEVENLKARHVVFIFYFIQYGIEPTTSHQTPPPQKDATRSRGLTLMHVMCLNQLCTQGKSNFLSFSLGGWWDKSLPTSRLLTFMYSQIRLKTSAWSISLPPTPKKFASASVITTEGLDSVLFAPDSTFTLGFLATDCSDSAKISKSLV